MLISASRRTDIPAFYGTWFMNRVRAGYCLVPNPMNAKQVSRVALTPSQVSAIVFWTRNPAPFMRALDELDARGYRYYFQFTVNGYGPDMEPHVPPLERQIATFRELAQRLGAERVVWRYDPIVLSNTTPHGYHARTFEQLAVHLAGSTRRVVVSLVDYYRKTDTRLKVLERDHGVRFERATAPSEKTIGLLRHLRDVASRHGLEIRTCAESNLSASGIWAGRCVDSDLVHELWGLTTESRKDPGQREACGCSVAKDIGVADTCLHGCLYCYATRSHEAALRRHAEHDPAAPALWGNVVEEKVVVEPQLSLPLGKMR